MKRIYTGLAAMLLSLAILTSGCGLKESETPSGNAREEIKEEVQKNGETDEAQNTDDKNPDEHISISSDDTPYVIINDNVPQFSDDEIVAESFENYSELDSLGRCGAAFACVGTDIMPTEERGSIGKVKPSGWHTIKYENVDGRYLYNRCHLIGYQLSAENANEKNLITGTRYLNVEGMAPFENMVADYVKETNNHVMYRVTPVFEEENLLANGVHMEALSVEDEGDGIQFNVFVYNIQPGITIDYTSGDSSRAAPEKDNDTSAAREADNPSEEPAEDETKQQSVVSENTYILNTNTKKFHSPGCRDIKGMKDANKQEYTGSREDIVNQGYDACKHCHP